MGSKKNVIIGGAIVVIILFVLFSGKGEKGSAEYLKPVDKFFSLIKKGKPAAAADFIFSSNPWMSKKSEAVENVKNQLVSLKDLVGKYRDHEKMIEKEIAGRYVYLYYFVAYDRQPFRFIFEFYKPKDKWVLHGFSFDDTFDDNVEENAIEKFFKQ